jgi:hypothetical protein
MTSGEVIVETGKSQFIFYLPIFVYNLLISDSWGSLLLLSFLDVGQWAYSTIHGPRRLFVKACAGPRLSPTELSVCRILILLFPRSFMAQVIANSNYINFRVI